MPTGAQPDATPRRDASKSNPTGSENDALVESSHDALGLHALPRARHGTALAGKLRQTRAPWLSAFEVSLDRRPDAQPKEGRLFIILASDEQARTAAHARPHRPRRARSLGARRQRVRARLHRRARDQSAFALPGHQSRRAAGGRLLRPSIVRLQHRPTLPGSAGQPLQPPQKIHFDPAQGSGSWS